MNREVREPLPPLLEEECPAPVEDEDVVVVGVQSLPPCFDCFCFRRSDMNLVSRLPSGLEISISSFEGAVDADADDDEDWRGE